MYDLIISAIMRMGSVSGSGSGRGKAASVSTNSLSETDFFCTKRGLDQILRDNQEKNRSLAASGSAPVSKVRSIISFINTGY